MKVYMMVTQDKYSLPLDFDTSPTALARRLGLVRTAVPSYISRFKSGDLKPEYPRYICVEVEDEDDDESGWLDKMMDAIKENRG